MFSTCFEPEGSSSGRRIYIYIQLWYGTVCFTCIGVSSLVGRRVCNTLLPNKPTRTPGFETCRRHQNKNYNINLENVHFVG